MKKQKFTSGILLTSALALMSPALSSASFAEPAAESKAGSFEEITVTARQRSESLMDVPMAINVFTERAIEQAGIDRVETFMALVPNVTMISAQDPGTSFITIRGLTQTRNAESPVAVAIDGVLMASTQALRQELFDIEQIEVLKGPQGALYGRNAIGGAITIRTKQPTNEFEGWIRGGIGNGERVKAQGGVSGPIIEDKLLFRATASHLETDGLIDNIYLNEKADHYQDRTARLLVKFMPTENITVDLRGSGEWNKSGALYYVVNSGDPNDTSVPIVANVRGIGRREIYDLSMKIDVETQVGTITAVTAYNDTYNRSGGDNSPYSSAAIRTQDGDVDIQAFSQEIRFTSPSDQRFRYIFGAYTLLTDREALYTIGTDTGAGIIVPGYNPTNPINPTVAGTWDDRNYKAYAGFAQINFDITEKLEISGAMRYDRDKRDQTNLYPPSLTFGLKREAKFKKWQPKVSLTYKATEDMTLFASYSEGFRSGGFNAPGVAQIAANQVPPLLGVNDIFDQETSVAYEVGLKSRWYDRLTVNANVFMTDVKGQHYFSFLPAVGAQIVTNIDKVKLKGFELETALRLLEGLDLTAGFGYVDSEIKKYLVNSAFVGNAAPYIPKYTLNLGVQYSTAVTSNIDMTARVDYERRAKQYWEPGNFVARNPIELVRARLTLENEESGWSIAGWVENLFNERYNEDFVFGGFAFIAQPRSYGVDVTKKF